MYLVINVSITLVLLLFALILSYRKYAFIYMSVWTVILSFFVTASIESSSLGQFSNWNHYEAHVFIMVSFSLILFISVSDFAIGLYFFSVTGLFIASANYLKSRSVGIPIVWSDFDNNLIKEVIWKMTIKPHLIPYIVGVTLILIGGYCYSKLMKKQAFSLGKRGSVVILCGVCITLIFSVNSKATAQEKARRSYSGAIETFVASKDAAMMAEPNDYSNELMSQLVVKYQSQYPTNKVKKRQPENLIYILSESLIDPTIFPHTSWSADPMPTIHHLQSLGGGSLLSPVFGGGTANVEFSLLSGFDYNGLQPNSVAYNQVSQQAKVGYGMPHYLANQQYEVSAIHSHLKDGYKRANVYPLLSIPTFISRETMVDEAASEPIYYEEGYISDMSFVNRLVTEVSKTKKASFINGISMQNHYPYTETYKGKLDAKDCLLENYQTLNNGEQLALYARGVKKTDDAIAFLMKKLEALDEPTTVVFYGDHAPSLNAPLYEDAFFTANQQLNKHLTPYFIWNNKQTITTHPQIINPGFLGNLALANMSAPQSSFYQFENDLMAKLPAYNTKTKQFFDSNGNPCQLTPHLKEQLHDYNLIQYDMFCGEGYSKALFSIKGSD